MVQFTSKILNMIKKYVKVNVDISADGVVVPKIIYFDDTAYAVERVLDVRMAPSLKVGGFGTRYTVRINGKQTYLWEDRGKFYVEQK